MKKPNIFQSLFYTTSATAKNRKSGVKPSVLRLECLEERRLLSVSPIDDTAANYVEVTPLTSDSSDEVTKTDAQIITEQNARARKTITVTTLSDTSNATDGKITLREAISYAGEGYTIRFDTSGTIRLSGTQLEIYKSLTINGGGNITIDANQQSRCFYVGANISAMFNGLTIQNGKVVNDNGGGICGDGNSTITVTNSTISDNSIYASGDGSYANGGGIYGNGATTIINSTISGNSIYASGDGSRVNGGGIYGDGNSTITITNSTISDNSIYVSGDGSRATGGGIYGHGTTVAIINSTISGNTVSVIGSVACGGGIAVDSSIIINSIISGNTVSAVNTSSSFACGGGIWGGNSTVINSTISGNSVSATGYSSDIVSGGSIVSGGGIDGYGFTIVINSIISGNLLFVTDELFSAYGGGIFGYDIYLSNSNVSMNFNDNFQEEYVTYGLPEGFVMPDIDLTVAVLDSPTERLEREGTLVLDASQSYNASKYYWDLNSDGTYDYSSTSPKLTLCGADYVDDGTLTGDVITWDKLASLGYHSGDMISVTLGTATKSGIESLDSRTVNINLESSTQLLTTSSSSSSANSATNLNTSEASQNVLTQSNGMKITTETAAKKIAYDHLYQEGDVIVDEESGKSWSIDKIITNNARDGFYAVSLICYKTDENGEFIIGSDGKMIRDTEEVPILAFRGTVKTVSSWVKDLEGAGSGNNDFEECKEELLEYVKSKDFAFRATGHSLGGGQALRFTALATSQGINVQSVDTYNAVGISWEQARKFNDNYLLNGVTNYVVKGDVVSLAGQSFLSGKKVTNIVYETSSPINKHSGLEVNYFENRLNKNTPNNGVETYTSEQFNSPFFHYSGWKWEGWMPCRFLAEGIRIGLYSTGKFVENTLYSVKLKQDSDTAVSVTLKQATDGTLTAIGKLSLDGSADCSLDVELDISKGYLDGLSLIGESTDQYLANGLRLTDFENLTFSNFGVEDQDSLELSGKAGWEVTSLKDILIPGTNQTTNSIISAVGDFVATEKEFSLSNIDIPKTAVSLIKTAGKNLIFDPIVNTLQSTGAMALHIGNSIIESAKLVYNSITQTTMASGCVADVLYEEVPLLGGAQLNGATMELTYSENNPRGNNILYKGSVVTDSISREVGVQYDFSGNIDLLGVEETQLAPVPNPVSVQGIQPLSSSAIVKDLLLQLSWSTPNDSVSCVLILPDGTHISESAFSDYGLELCNELSTSTQRTYAVSTSTDVSLWSFGLANSSETVKTTWYSFIEPMAVAISTVTVNDAGNIVASVDCTNMSDDTVLTFYFDNDSEGFDGVQAFQTTVGELVNGTVEWLPKNVLSGEYYVYVTATNHSQLPVKGYGEGTVTITTQAKISVTDTVGNTTTNLSFGTFAVGNASIAYQQKSFCITNNGTGPLSLSDWRLLNDGAFNVQAYSNDGNAIALSDMTLNSGESITITVGLNSKYMGNRQNSFTLTATTNDAEMPTVELAGSVIYADEVGKVTVESGANEEEPQLVKVLAGQEGAYQVVLNAQPTENVTVYISSSNSSVKTDVSALTFTAENWNAPQTVKISVTGRIPEDSPVFLSHSLVSNDISTISGALPDVLVVTPPGKELISRITVNTPDFEAVKISEEATVLNEWSSFNLELWGDEFSTRTIEVTYDANLYMLDQTASSVREGFQIEFGNVKTENGKTTVTVQLNWSDEEVLCDGSRLLTALKFSPIPEENAGAGENHLRGQLVAGESVNWGVSVGNTEKKMQANSVVYDLNDDGKVDIIDLVQFARSFGKQSINPDANNYTTTAWQSNFDASRDGEVSILDLVLFARNFGFNSTNANQISYADDYVPGVPEIMMSLEDGMNLEMPSANVETPEPIMVSNVTDLAMTAYWNEEEEDFTEIGKKEEETDYWKIWE